MPDLALRFHKDLLTLSGAPERALLRYGADPELDPVALNLFEPEVVEEVLKMEAMVGAQCLVTNTAAITRARLAHERLEDSSREVAREAVSLVAKLRPQHILAEIGPTLLPLDTSSKTSLTQNRDQYAQAVRDFEGLAVDAFYLRAQRGLADLRCALMGVRMVSPLPIIASVAIDDDALLEGRGESFAEALALMEEYEADVAGFITAARPEVLLPLVTAMTEQTDLPLLAELVVAEQEGPRRLRPSLAAPSQPGCQSPDELLDEAVALIGSGVQFFRAVGASTASYTGALAIACTTGEAIR